MNHVDTHVKNMMLRSPTLFPTRISAIAYMMLSAGAGYRWDKKGQLGCVYGHVEAVDHIKMDDLDADLAAAKQRLRMDELQGRPVLYSQRTLADVKLERLQRQHMGRNIDTYVQADPLRAGKGSLSWLEMYSSLNGSAMGTLYAVKKVNKDWACAADEAAFAYLELLNQQAKEKRRLPAHLKEVQKQLSAVLDHLEPITKRRETARKMLDIWTTLKAKPSRARDASRTAQAA